MEQKASDQEIDLLGLLVKFYLTLRKNAVLTILLPVLGLIVGIVISNFSKSTVKSSMMIETDLISEDESKFLMDQLDKADSIKGLSKEQQSKINRIEYEVKKGETIAGVNSTPVYLKITTVTHDKTLLPFLQKLLVDYLNRTEPIVRNRTEKERFYRGMIVKLDSELEGLKDVKKEISDKSKATFLDPSDLFAKSVALYDQRVRYEIALDHIKSVHVVKGFGSLTKNAKWSHPVYAIVGFLCGVVILMLVLFIKFFNKYSREFQKQT